MTIRLSLGCAVFDDFSGLYFTIQSLRMMHAAAMKHCELIVIDNNPGSNDGKMTAGFVQSIANDVSIRYISFTDAVGTSVPRDRIFREARGEAVMCIDSHVLIVPGAIQKLLDYYEAHPQTNDLLSGPMLYDNLKSISTHFADQWRDEMWGTWDTDPRGIDPHNPPFEIPAMGLGLFTCRKTAWLGFNENFRGFGGEEFYIHEKFRQAGAKCLCLPFLRWGHRFGRPNGVTYPLTTWNKIRNYVIGHTELGFPLDRIKEHFLDTGKIPLEEWESLIADPNRLLPEKQGCKPCQQKNGGTEATLENLYQAASSTGSDINEHCPKLRELASQSEHVTEFGMRPAVSTVALLAGQPKKFVTYDIADNPMMPILKQRQGVTEFDFRRGESLSAEIEETDLLFIDTRHTADHLYAELNRHSPKVRQRIALHDTQIFGETGEDGSPGLLPAMRRFVTEHPEWSVIYHAQNNHGFTVLSRDERDKPKLPGMATQAWNFAKAVAAHVADGAEKTTTEQFEQRLEICALCQNRNNENCSVCGCPLAARASWRSSPCPLGKWPALIQETANAA